MFIEEERRDACMKVKINLTLHERLKLLFSNGFQICLGNNMDDPKITKVWYHTEIDVIK